MNQNRRLALKLAASSLALPGISACSAGASTTEANEQVSAAVARFAALPADTSCLIQADHPSSPWQIAHDADTPRFIGSAVKTFILAQYLKDIEDAKADPTQQLAVDDARRSLGSPILQQLSGTMAPTFVLEAMISHSDNTATDIALSEVSPSRVRKLIADAGLTSTRIPDSTRRLFSYIAGAPYGDDLGWAGMQQIEQGWTAGPMRSPLNDQETMMSSATDMVSWYRQALRGDPFKRPETLTEFKRIQNMADAIAHTVPSDIKAYGKGGSIDWDDFHCLSFPGQMRVAGAPVTFCFTINWTGPDEGVPSMTQQYIAAVASVLNEAALAITG